jgi:transposase
VEIINGIERRRRWRIEEKIRIVVESQQPGVTVADVARRHDVSRGLVWAWRRQARRGLLRAPEFLPVRVTEAPMASAPICSAVPMASRAGEPRDSRIEIILPAGTTIRAGHDVSVATLRRVLAASRG